MAHGRSRVEKDSDTHAPHPFLFFLSCFFSLLEGLEPTHTPIRSPGTLAPQLETQASPRPLQVSPPHSSCPGTGSPQSTPPSSWCPSQPCPSLLQVRNMPQQHTEVDMPHVEFKDQEPQLQGENQEQQQGEETRDEEACQGPASQVSSPSVATSSANRQLMMLEGKSGSCFSSLDSSIDILKKRAQELIENINESRQKDHALMTNFRDSLKIKVSDLTEKLEERMYQIYNHHNKIIQEKLQEFTQKMAKISHLETELKQVCHTVETVYKDLCVQPEATTLEEQIHKDGEC
ncbi:synaptonemal complex central element protein 2 isoform X2 [Ovis aries]|uniref:synaptonemal complex central element protein 2 isoform X2 n=2 Tax=Ovis TaxID=9935 RepID=UPI001C2E2EAE|nr:synaptonemal complex central element protein 2 isoform X2 [Ovis aries]